MDFLRNPLSLEKLNGMSVQSVVRFFIKYNQPIIEWTFIAILLLLGFWVGLRFLVKKQQIAAVGVEPKEIDDSMAFSKARSVRETQSFASTKTSALPETLEGLNAAQQLVTDPTVLASTLVESDQELMKKFAEKDNKIEELESLLEDHKSVYQQGGSEETLARLKELKRKLDEYEIIEDDIADLSQYKEENAKLKRQLKALKLKLNDDETDLDQVAQEANNLLKQG